MKKFLLPAVAAGAVVVAAVFAPTLAATAAPAHAAKASKQYTLSVDGNGKHATVVYTTITVKKEGSKTSVPTPVVHTIAKAHEPWSKHVKSNASLYEIAAVQTTGTKLSCTIKNTHGTVIAYSTSKGKNTIVTCIVAKDALLAGVGSTGSGSSGGSGSSSGSGSSTGSGSDPYATPSILLPVR